MQDTGIGICFGDQYCQCHYVPSSWLRQITVPLPYARISGRAKEFLVHRHPQVPVPTALLPDFLPTSLQREDSAVAGGTTLPGVET